MAWDAPSTHRYVCHIIVLDKYYVVFSKRGFLLPTTQVCSAALAQPPAAAAELGLRAALYDVML